MLLPSESAKERGKKKRVSGSHTQRAPSPGPVAHLHEVVVDVEVGAAGVLLLALLLHLVELHHVHLVAEQAAHAAEAAHELRALLRLVGDQLEREAHLLVVLGEELDQVDGLDLVGRAALDVGRVQDLLHLGLLHLLRGVVVVARRRPVGGLHGDAQRLEVLEGDERVHGAHVDGLHRVADAVAVHVRVEGELVVELLEELLLLDQLHVAERVGREVDGLVEADLTGVSDVDELDDDLLQTRVEHVGEVEALLELSRTGEHEAEHVRAVVGDEVLRRALRDLAQVVVAALLADTREAVLGLATATVLLRELDGEGAELLLHVAGDGEVVAPVTVDDDEAKALIGLEHAVELIGVELVVAHVERARHGLERLDVEGDLLLLVVLGEHGAAVDDQAVRRHA
mmetsp:Transcript_16231/g.50376  ORF Transcript_16231/g.50376 Transcript_16231/m.50376 type:complete len:399 (+) Transcript_16231:242-1438(+)